MASVLQEETEAEQDIDQDGGMKGSPSSSSRPASYVFPFVSFTFPLGVSSFPFFSQIR